MTEDDIIAASLIIAALALTISAIIGWAVLGGTRAMSPCIRRVSVITSFPFRKLPIATESSVPGLDRLRWRRTAGTIFSLLWIASFAHCSRPPPPPIDSLLATVRCGDARLAGAH